MNFELNDVQRALQDSLARLLHDRYKFEKRRLISKNAVGHDTIAWDQLVDLGLMGLMIPEKYGGFGSQSEYLLPVMKEFGAALSLEPYLPLVMGVTGIRLAAHDAQCSSIFPNVLTGKCKLAWAHEEHLGRHSPWWVETTAFKDGDAWILNGTKALVLGASLADKFVVSARFSGQPSEREGTALFIVDALEIGSALRNFRLVDDSCAGELKLKDVRANSLGDAMDINRSLKAIDGSLAVGLAAICADMWGAMDAAYRLTVDYLNTRQQFGRLIGQNQALRHRVAEMLVNLELAKSMAIAAAVAADNSNSQDANYDLHRAKFSVARHARQLVMHAIQLHGGIGMTEEYAVGHYLRRVHVLDQLLGDGDSHAARLSEILSA